MAAEPQAIVAHSILEIARGMSYEVVNVRIRSLSRPISVFCAHPSPQIVGFSCQLVLRKYKRTCKSVLGHWYGHFILCASGSIATQNLKFWVVIYQEWDSDILELQQVSYVFQTIFLHQVKMLVRSVSHHISPTNLCVKTSPNA